MTKKAIELEKDEWQTTIADMVGIAFGEQFKAGKKLSEGDLASIITTCINISNGLLKAERINYNAIKAELVKQLGRWQEEKIYPEWTYLWKSRRSANGSLVRDGSYFIVKAIKWKGASYETYENIIVPIDMWDKYNCEEVIFADFNY